MRGSYSVSEILNGTKTKLHLCVISHKYVEYISIVTYKNNISGKKDSRREVYN